MVNKYIKKYTVLDNLISIRLNPDGKVGILESNFVMILSSVRNSIIMPNDLCRAYKSYLYALLKLAMYTPTPSKAMIKIADTQ